MDIPVVPSPHEWIERDAGEPDPELINLNLPEFALGYLREIKTIADDRTRVTFFNHLLEILEDASKYVWPAVRQYEHFLLRAIERGRITWENEIKIQTTRMQQVTGAQKLKDKQLKQQQPQQQRARNTPTSDVEKIAALKAEGKSPCPSYATYAPP